MTLQRANVWSSATPVDPIQYYVAGGSNLGPAVSTDDYYHQCGLYGLRSYDLLTWGSEGTALATSYGYRYVWLCGPDHPTSQTQAWRDSAHFVVGFSNDPGVFPDKLIPIIAWNNSNTALLTAFPADIWNMYEWGVATYNPDDVNGLPFYFFGEGATTSGTSGIQHCEILWRSSDLLNWTVKKVSHPGSDNSAWTSFNYPRRITTNSWESVGPGGLTGNVVPIRRWTSSNGIDYTIDAGTAELNRYRLSDGTMLTWTQIANTPYVNVYNPTTSDLQLGYEGYSTSGTRYRVSREDVGAYVGTNPKPQFVSIVPVSSTGSVLGTPAPTHISAQYDGWFPGPTFLQNVSSLYEDGIAHIYASHGFTGAADTLSFGYPYPTQWDLNFSPNGSTTSFSGSTLLAIKPYSIVMESSDGVTYYDNGQGVFAGSAIASSSISYATKAISVTFVSAPPAGSIHIRYVENDTIYHPVIDPHGLIAGGLREQFLDYHTYIYDSTAAAGAAPAGVTASCAAGVVTLSWYDALPHQNYRVYRGTTSTTQTTLVANVTGLTTTDAPTVGAQYWYKVVTLNSSVESGSRVVHCYVSSASQLANQHINRVIDDGGDKTKINVTRLDAAISFLIARNWIGDLLFWASPDWGVKESAGHIVKVYCLGTTRLPRGGDLTFDTSTSTYAVAAIGNCAAFVNAANNSFGYFGAGRYNPIRKKRELTVAAMYARTQTAADITFAGLKTGNGKYEGNWIGTEQPGISLSHNAGTPGTIEFKLKDDNFGTGARQNTATVASSGGTYEISIGTCTGTQVVAYSNGAGGTAVTGVDPDPHHFRDTALAGARGASLIYPMLGVGSRNCSATAVTNPTAYTAPTRSYPANEAQFKASDIFVMARGVSGSDATLLTGLLNGFATGTTSASGYVAPLKLRVRA